MKRVGIDIGGTFTDLVVFDETTGSVERTKTPTTPRAPEEGFLRAIADQQVDLG
jgi:N-methylhydantoinase A